MADGKVVLRRTWPQRIVMLACVGVIGSALAAAWFVQNLYVAVAEIPRVQISGDLLVTETEPGTPVNFLIIGNDSALGLDPDSPVHIDRDYDDRGTFNADSISLVRVDPIARQVWVVSIPRDLVVDVPRSKEWKINATTLIGGPELLIETITDTFDVQLNHYVQLDFLAFQEVVDQLGGVPVWFENPARDLASHLDVPVAGCVVMDGTESLAYVRARQYEEFIDGEWVSIGADQPDLARIQRQQDFLVLALDRAVARGARNLPTMAALIEAGAQSVVLDSGLTPAELIDLAEAFADFDPESLQRFTLDVIPEDEYKHLTFVLHDAKTEHNDDVLDIFRGVADGVSPADVRFSVVGADILEVDSAAEVLVDEVGFDVTGQQQIMNSSEPSVVVYPPGARSEAELLARYLIPVPALVEDPSATDLTLLLGSEFEQVSFFFPHDLAETRAAIDAHGDVSVPDLGTTSTLPSTTTSTTVAVTTTDGPAPAASGTDPGEGAESGSVQTTTTRAHTIGRPPEGETCG